jgi:hypothetical protein
MLKKWFLYGVIGLVVVFGLIQLVPVDRNNPPVETDLPAPLEVKTVLQSACYDCHSNETTWPWYSYIAPVSWLVAYDVRAGREELNFSTWNRYSTKQQVEKLKESLEEIDEGEMPPWFYVAVHRDIQLSARDRAVLRTWARGSTAPDGPTATSPQQRPEHRN